MRQSRFAEAEVDGAAFARRRAHFGFFVLVAAGVAAVSAADLLASTAVLVGVFALAIVGVAGACLWGMRIGH